MPRTKLELPKGLDASQVGTRLAMEVRSGEDHGRAVRKDRFDRLLAEYEHNPPEGETDSQAHVNIIQVKIDALGTNVMRTMMQQEPYCVAQTYKLDGVNQVIEKVVQFFAVKGMVEDRASSVSPDAGLFNVGILHNEWKSEGNWYDPTPGEEISAVNVEDFFVYPPTVADEVWKAKSCGHRIYVRRSELERLKKEGAVVDVSGSVEDPGAVREENFPSVPGTIHHDSAGSGDNELIELWWVCYRGTGARGKEEWFKALISEKEQKVLYSRRLKKNRPPYHVFRYKNTKGEFWSKSSVGNDLQGMQLEADNLVRLWLDGIGWNIYGVGFARGTGNGEQYIEVKKGGLVEGDWTELPNYQFPKADLSYIPDALGFMVNYSDQIARISQSGTGGKESGETTATQAAIMRAGQQAGVDDYIQTAGKGLVSLYESIHEDLVLHMDEWVPVLANYLGLSDEDLEALRLPTMWRLNTKSIGTTPGAQLQVAQLIAERQAMGAQMGGSSIDGRGLDTIILNLAQRLGLPDADKLQLPENPQQMVFLLAQSMGIDPQILMRHIEEAQKEQQFLQEGQQEFERNKQVEKAARGLGLIPEDGGAQANDGVPKLPGGNRKA